MLAPAARPAPAARVDGAPAEPAPALVTAVLEAVRAHQPRGVLGALRSASFQARLAALTFGTALAFAVAGLVCLVCGVPPQGTSLAGDPSADLLGQYVALLEEGQ